MNHVPWRHDACTDYNQRANMQSTRQHATNVLMHAAGLLVDDARQAYEASVANGGKGARAPVTLQDGAGGTAVVSEVGLYGDVVLRFVSGDWQVSCQHNGRGGGRALGGAVLVCDVGTSKVRR